MINKEIYNADSLPWLAAAQARLRDSRAAGRLPHGLLIHAAPGLGGELLARWAAALAICQEKEAAPCGTCKPCRLLAANNHPDFLWIERKRDEEKDKEAKELHVDQIRDLCETLSLKSYAGGYKVAVIAEADLMNANAANALLKTLEEPPPSTLLVLCSSRPSRLPATIVSRCQQLKVFKPKPDRAIEWLNARKSNPQWPVILQHASGAPLRALALEEDGFGELDREMRAVVAELTGHKLDIPGTAERWLKAGLASRLDWLETWLTASIRVALAPGATPGQSPAPLPSPGRIRNIRGLYKLLERVQGIKLELSTPLNQQLAAEDLLLKAAMALD